MIKDSFFKDLAPVEAEMIREMLRWLIAALWLLILSLAVSGGIILVIWIFHLVFGITVS